MMKNNFLFLLLLSNFFLFGQSNYFVSENGNNSNNGSLNSPWRNLQFSINQLTENDTLNVMNGTYNEKIQLPISGLTIRNHSNHHPIIDAINLFSQISVIEIYNVSNVTIEGLEIKNNIMLDAQGILVEGNCQNIKITNCKIHDIHFSSDENETVNANKNAQGIIVYGTNSTSSIKNIQIINNELYDCRLGFSEGIAINGNVDGFEISRNLVHNLTNIGIDAIGHEGTCSNASKDQARNGIIKQNIVYFCLSNYATSAGIYIDGGKNIRIENNTSSQNGYGIEIGCENVNKKTDSIFVNSNVFYNNELAGIALGGYAYPNNSGKVTNSKITNNTCFYNDFNTSYIGELYLSYSENCSIENNIFHTHSNNVILYAELSQLNLNFDYNLFYCPGGIISLNLEWNGTEYSDYSEFITESGTNANSIFTDPMFVSTNINSPNLHLMDNSPAINKGNPDYIALSNELDFDLENRINGIIDCGADEFYEIAEINNANLFSKNVYLYPNPCSKTLSFSNFDYKISKISFYNLSGSEIISFNVTNENGINLIENQLQSGMYYVFAFDDLGQTLIYQKIILE